MNVSVLKKGSALAGGIISAVFTVVPEDVFKYGFISCNWSESTVVILNRLIACVIIFAVANLVYCCWRKNRKSVKISEKAYTISIEYGDLFEIKKGKKVVNFDECFTTTVGDRPEDIKPNTVCGQYLQLYPIDDMQDLIEVSRIKPEGTSKYNNQARYTLGTIIPRNDFLLMAFAKLDEDGLGGLTYDQYLKCLNKMWEQIDLHHGTDDVYLPVLGSRITRFNREFTQQELLDIMIASYRLSPKKLKAPNVLHIVCKERNGFSLNDIFGIE